MYTCKSMCITSTPTFDIRSMRPPFFPHTHTSSVLHAVCSQVDRWSDQNYCNIHINLFEICKQIIYEYIYIYIFTFKILVKETLMAILMSICDSLKDIINMIICIQITIQTGIKWILTSGLFLLGVESMTS